MNTSILDILDNMPAEIIEDNQCYWLVIRKMQDDKFHVSYENYNEESYKSELFWLERDELIDAITNVYSWLKENNYNK